MKIKYKLSLIVGAIVAGALIITAVLAINQASQISLGLSLRSMDYLTASQEEYWKGRLDRYIQVLRSLANIMEDYESMDAEIRRDRFDSMLMATLSSEPNLLQLYTIWRPNAVDGMDDQYIDRAGSTATGQYAAMFTRETGDITVRATIDVDDAMAYFNGPNSRMDRVEDPIPRTIMGRDTFLVRMMVPIVNHRTNQVVGGVALLYDVAAVQPVLQNVINSFPEISGMAMYTRDGRILGHLVNDRVGRTLNEAEPILYGDDLGMIREAIQRGENTTTTQYSTVLSTNLMMILHSFTIGNSSNTWTLMIGTSENYVMTDVNRMTSIIIIIIAVVLAVALVIVYFAMNNVSKPIVEVANTLKDIAEGEGDLTRVIEIKTKDEIGTLAQYFNQTLEKIKNVIINIKSGSVSLSGIGTELANNMTETAAAMNQITANIQSVKQNMVNQSTSVTETNSAMEQITANINKLNDHVEVQTTSVVQSSSAIEEMLANIQSVTQTLIKNTENVEKLSDASEVGRTGLQDVAADIQEISQESEGLLEINSVMENIASQTNLLSMNAAIEAAHAGEAGKGFAVVADEIRKLAVSSSEQSKTISTVLKKIKSSIDKITQSTSNVLNRFETIDTGVRTVADQEENIRNSMEEQGQGSKQILESIGHLNETTQQVKEGSSEMLKGASIALREANNLEKATQEITSGMNEMASGVDQVNKAVNHINELTEQNREASDMLMKEVEKFKIE